MIIELVGRQMFKITIASIALLVTCPVTNFAADREPIYVKYEMHPAEKDITVVSRGDTTILYDVIINDGTCLVLLPIFSDSHIDTESRRRCVMASTWAEIKCMHWQLNVGQSATMVAADPSNPWMKEFPLFTNPCGREIITLEIRTNKGTFRFNGPDG